MEAKIAGLKYYLEKSLSGDVTHHLLDTLHRFDVVSGHTHILYVDDSVLRNRKLSQLVELIDYHGVERKFRAATSTTIIHLSENEGIFPK